MALTGRLGGGSDIIMSALIQIASSNARGTEYARTVPDVRVLRLSVTDRCNFRCRYCLPEEGVARLDHRELLPFEELVRLTEWLAGHPRPQRGPPPRGGALAGA